MKKILCVFQEVLWTKSFLAMKSSRSKVWAWRGRDAWTPGLWSESCLPGRWMWSYVAPSKYKKREDCSCALHTANLRPNKNKHNPWAATFWEDLHLLTPKRSLILQSRWEECQWIHFIYNITSTSSLVSVTVTLWVLVDGTFIHQVDLSKATTTCVN